MALDGLEYGYGIDGTTTNAGSSTNPYAINDIDDFSAINNHLSEGAYYQQTDDITLTSNIQIGGTTRFNGKYNGNGYSIIGDSSTYTFQWCPNGSSVIERICISDITETTRLINLSDIYGFVARNIIFKNINLTTSEPISLICTTRGTVTVSNIIFVECGATSTSYSSTACLGLQAYSDWSGSCSISNSVALSSSAGAYIFARHGSYGKTVSNCYASSDCSPSPSTTSANSSNGLSITATLYNNPDFWFNNTGGSLSQTYLNYDTDVWEWDSTTSLPKLKHSTVVTTPTVKVFNATSNTWVDGTPYVFNGTSWVQASKVYVYNGTSGEWVEKT